MFLSSFFFYCDTYYRDLHSFPTRRSSDLSQSSSGQGLKKSGVARDGGRRCSDARDRKSTRLNSSHVAISYAVFCLKKKKTLPTTIKSPLKGTTSIASKKPITHSNIRTTDI